MRAYETSDGMIEIFNCEPDEIITREEFDKRNERAKLDIEISETEKKLAELKAKRAGYADNKTAATANVAKTTAPTITPNSATATTKVKRW